MVVAAQAAPAPPGFDPRGGPIWVDGQEEIQIRKHAAQHAGRANYLAEVDGVIGAIQQYYRAWSPDDPHHPEDGDVWREFGDVWVGRGYATIRRVRDNPGSGNYRFLVEYS